MPAWTLTVRYAREPQRKPAAWFIPGRQLADWWEELRGWGSLDDELRLLVLPHSRSDRSPRGLLVIGRRPESLPVSLRCRPYGCIGERFYLPIEARLEPALSEAELENLLPAAGRTFVFHPALGLVGFEPAECLRIQQLLAAPPQQPADWNRAQPGTYVNDRLLSIRPLKMPTPEEMLEQGRGDIGDRADEFLKPARSGSARGADRDDAKQGKCRAASGDSSSGTQGDDAETHADEGAGAADRRSSAAGGMLARMLKSLANWLRSTASPGAGEASPPPAQPTGKATAGSAATKKTLDRPAPAHPGWLGKSAIALANCLGTIAAWAARSDASRRPPSSSEVPGPDAAELAKQLLQMLTDKPDQGLQYAPRLNASSAQHDVAGSADELARHDVRFDLEGLDDTSGAGACIPYELFIRLRQMYYKLAMREVQLGRHRRAAYIFAFLLNDFGDAARVLEQGLHFREAAALYERIGQLEAAGLCLEKGGCWPEAIAVWQLLQDHLRVAAIHERLDQIDEAAEAYGRAVQQRQEAGDYLGAAELLVTKLNRSWEALEVLQHGWQQATQARAAKASAQAAECLRQSFRLRDQLQRHDSSLQQLAWLQAEYRDTPLRVPIAEIAAQIASEYSAAPVRTRAAELTRVLAATALCAVGAASDPETKRVLQAVKKLVPQDQILKRDCDRYLAHTQPPGYAQPSHRGTQRVVLLKTHQLSRRTLWLAALADGNAFFAVGISPSAVGHQLTILRGRWSSGQSDVQRLKGWSVPDDLRSLVLGFFPGAEPQLWVHIPEQAAGPTTRLVAPAGVPDVTVLTPSWLPVRTLAMTRDTKGVVWCVEERHDGLVVTALLGNQLVESFPLHYLSRYPIPPAIVVRDSIICVASGDKLEVREQRDQIQSVALRAAIKHLGSWPAARDSLFAATHRGGILLNARRLRRSSSLAIESFLPPRDTFTGDLVDPVIAAVSSQWVVAAAANGLLVLRADQDTLTPYGELTATTDTPVAVLETSQRNQFAVLTVHGQLLLYETRHAAITNR